MPYDATSGGAVALVRPRCMCCPAACDEVRSHALTPGVHLCGGCAHRFLRWLTEELRRRGADFHRAAFTSIRAPRA